MHTGLGHSSARAMVMGRAVHRAEPPHVAPKSPPGPAPAILPAAPRCALACADELDSRTWDRVREAAGTAGYGGTRWTKPTYHRFERDRCAVCERPACTAGADYRASSCCACARLTIRTTTRQRDRVRHPIDVPLYCVTMAGQPIRVSETTTLDSWPGLIGESKRTIYDLVSSTCWKRTGQHFRRAAMPPTCGTGASAFHASGSLRSVMTDRR